MNLEKGEILVRLARRAVEEYLKNSKVITPPSEDWIMERRGVFTTIRSYPSEQLRGCIGFPYPIKPLGEALVESAISAATRDPRFFPVSVDELPSLVFEVTVLTPPVKLDGDPSSIVKRVKIGKHGLIIERGYYSGLLLPQVPGEVGWRTAEEFLDGTCEKAGLPKGCWREEGTSVYVFEGEVFKEETPGGKVVRVVSKG